MDIRGALVLMLLGGVLAGCASNVPQMPRAFPAPDLERPPRQNDGAIYQPGYDEPLFVDRTARGVGDIVTVILEEETDASKNASMELGRSYDFSLPMPTIAGRSVTWNGLPISFAVESDQNFDGGGSASQSNTLTGTISAIVTKVTPSGNLVIQGRKQLTLNRGDQYLTITGIIRPEDIRPNNTISSRQVANARISYTGSGALADSSTMGWLARLFMSVFWPF